jgi:long-subunit fatty acid transport protein
MAWKLSDNFSWGAGVRICRTALESVSNSSTHVIETATSNTIVLAEEEAINAEIYHLRFSLGAQFRAGDHWEFGVNLRSPGIKLGDSGSFTIEGLANSPIGSLDVSTRLTDLEVNYMMPFEAGFGVAYSTDRWEVELDLTCHAGLGKFAVFKSDGDIRIITEVLGIYGIGALDFPSSYIHHQSVVNFSFGGRYRVKESIWLHGGFYSDMSPVRDADDPVFKKIDMFGLTLGMTQEGEHHAFSLGLGYTFGESEEFEISDLQGTETTDATLSIGSLNLMMAATFKF